MYYGPTIKPPVHSSANPSRRIRVGIVGYGSAGRRFHPYLLGRVPDFELVAVASRSPERRALAEAGRAELIVKPEEAARAIAVVDAAMRSAKTGETVRMGMEGP